MFKAIVFMSAIVSLAFSAPYGEYGGSGSSSSFNGGLGKVDDIGINIDSGRGLGVGLGGKGMEMSFGNVPNINLFEDRNKFVPSVSSGMPSSVDEEGDVGRPRFGGGVRIGSNGLSMGGKRSFPSSRSEVRHASLEI